MARRNRAGSKRSDKREPNAFDHARDELFRAIRQCGVMDADEAEQTAWMDETVAYLKERHPDLSNAQLTELKETGIRFCQPVIPHGKEHTAISTEGASVA